MLKPNFTKGNKKHEQILEMSSNKSIYNSYNSLHKPNEELSAMNNNIINFNITYSYYILYNIVPIKGVLFDSSVSVPQWQLHHSHF